MKCEIIGCGKPMSEFDPIKPRVDGIIIEVLSTHRAIPICLDHAQKLGLVK